MLKEKIISVNIEDEMQNSYLDYSMSVIVSRALPDVRDGLKPVQRRILYDMNELGLTFGRLYKKSARVVGDVMGKYHPHGDKAIYDTIVRMVQNFSLRYPLVDGQGNFGSIDGDSPAAMRYTEIRLNKIANTILNDLDKDTVNFITNYDETTCEPVVLPSLLPNLLVNGSSGIAVGMATNIPPHNLIEVIDGIIALINDSKINVEELMKYVIAPDFPTAGLIWGLEGVKEAYETGRGKIIIRAKVGIEIEKGNKESIIINELPFQVNKTKLIENIVYLIKDKKISDITNIKDESDKDGMRVVIDIKRGASTNIILNNLFKHTQMQITFGIIMLALVDGIPRVLDLKEIMEYFIEHRLNVIIRRTQFELNISKKRIYILEGFMTALDNIKEVIKIIRGSKNVLTAQINLIKRFKLVEVQVKAILVMRFQQLTGLEKNKIKLEYKELLKLIEKLKRILISDTLRRKILSVELKKLKEIFGDERRTSVIKDIKDGSGKEFVKEFIKDEEVVITISHKGYIKRTPIIEYKKQLCGGKGIIGVKIRQEDFVEYMFIATFYNNIVFFTNVGKCYSIKVYEVKEAKRTARGNHISNYIIKGKEENITAILNVKEFIDNFFVTMITKKGMIKKINLLSFEKIKKTGIKVITLKSKDRLSAVEITNGKQKILVGTFYGKAICFREDDINPTSRTTMGVIAIRLNDGDKVIGMTCIKQEKFILVVTDNGFGKRSELSNYRIIKRGGRGIITMKLSERNGNMISINGVNDEDELILITKKGTLLRQNINKIVMAGRNTLGLKLINLNKGDKVSAIAKGYKKVV